jgi:hypothetical protein
MMDAGTRLVAAGSSRAAAAGVVLAALWGTWKESELACSSHLPTESDSLAQRKIHIGMPERLNITFVERVFRICLCQ